MKRLFLSLITICLVAIIPCEGKCFEYTLSVGSIFQNESDYMEEWIEYHKMVGVEHFFLYNNNSTDDYLSVLNPYIEEGIVELIQWPSVQQENDWSNFSFTTQTNAYNDAINRSKNVSKWLALIDLDEFIIPVQDSTLVECLEKNYSQVSGLCVNWQCYGTSHVHSLEKNYPMIGQLVLKMKWNHAWNNHSKSIVQPLHVLNCPNPHHCSYHSNHWAIDGNYTRCDSVPNTVIIDKIRINHYWTRDEEFFYGTKLARYEKWGVKLEGIKAHADSMNEEFDGIMSRFVPQLNEILRSK